MSAYQTIVVGTDGSESSLRAVERAVLWPGTANSSSHARTFPMTGDRARLPTS